MLTQIGKLGIGQVLVGDGLEPVGGEERQGDDEEGEAGEVDGALQGPVGVVPLVERHLAGSPEVPNVPGTLSRVP